MRFKRKCWAIKIYYQVDGWRKKRMNSFLLNKLSKVYQKSNCKRLTNKNQYNIMYYEKLWLILEYNYQRVILLKNVIYRF